MICEKGGRHRQHQGYTSRTTKWSSDTTVDATDGRDQYGVLSSSTLPSPQSTGSHNGHGVDGAAHGFGSEAFETQVRSEMTALRAVQTSSQPSRPPPQMLFLSVSIIRLLWSKSCEARKMVIQLHISSA
jgi:hypothetical protein